VSYLLRNACTKSGSLRFSQFSGFWLILSVYILMSFVFPFARFVRSSVILLLPLFNTTCNTHRLYTIQTAPKFFFIDYFWSCKYMSICICIWVLFKSNIHVPLKFMLILLWYLNLLWAPKFYFINYFWSCKYMSICICIWVLFKSNIHVPLKFMLILLWYLNLLWA
jgi:hypothetical protein